MIEAYGALLAPLAAFVAVLMAPARWGRRLLWALAAAAGASFVALWRLRAEAQAAAHAWRLPWIESLGLDFVVTIDPLSILYGLTVSGVGFAIALYAIDYFAHDKRPLKTFSLSLIAFMGAMLGTVLAGNLLQLFLFWELTSVASFLLIGFDFRRAEARRGARLAFVVTSVTGLCLLAGILLLGLGVGSFEIGELLDMGPQVWNGLPYPTATLALLLIGAFGKSAQIPFFFWLPRAMSAPTPVSAYLHSATMVKLGIFLLARLSPVLAGAPDFTPILVTIGGSTLLLGAIAALFAQDLKAILAYSTISHLGWLVAYYGIAPSIGAHADDVQLLAHVLYKAPLFMVAGYLEHLTGTRDLRRLGGLLPKAPLAALITLIACASLVALPGSLGFVAKELLTTPLKGLWPAPWASALLVALLVAGALKVALAGRLLGGIFGGEERDPADPTHASATGLLPALAIALAGLAYGLLTPQAPSPFAGWQTTLGIFVVGAILYRLAGGARGFHRWHAPASLDLARPVDAALDAFPKFCARLVAWAQNDRPQLFLPLVATSFVAFLLWRLLPFVDSSFVPGIAWGSADRIAIALLLAASAFAPLFARGNLARIVVLSISGFLLVTYFVVYRAPDLAMTQLLIEAVSFLLVLYLLGRLGERDPRIPGFEAIGRVGRAARAGLAAAFGLVMAFLSLVMVNGQTPERLGRFFLASSLPDAHGANAVNTILVDYRGFDTLGEISVLAIAGLGIFALWNRSLAAPIRRRLSESALLRGVAGLAVAVTFLIAAFLHWRGHNDPGGGFIAGLVAALGLVLYAAARGVPAARRFFSIPPEVLCVVGLALAWLTAAAPLIFGAAFFEHFMGPYGLGTALAFDTGVFCVVVGLGTRIGWALLNPSEEAEDGSV